jgi:hypothetical protein
VLDKAPLNTITHTNTPLRLCARCTVLFVACHDVCLAECAPPFPWSAQCITSGVLAPVYECICVQAMKVLNMVKMYGKSIRISKSAQDKNSNEVQLLLLLLLLLLAWNSPVFLPRPEP